MPLGSLSGFTVAVTADRRSEEQASLIARRGGEVMHGPVIKTLPLGDEGGTREATQALIDDPPDVVVFSTALGVRGWFSAAAGLGLEEELFAALAPAEVVARGRKAVGAIVSAGLVDDVPFSSPTYQAILDAFTDRSPVGRDGAPVRVAVQLDGEDSGGLHRHLDDLGFDVVAVPVYRWLLPDDLAPAERVVGAVADGRVDAISFTSAHAVANFVAIARAAGVLDQVRASCRSGRVAVVCVGPVTAARAASLGLDQRIEPTQPRLGAMVARLAAEFDSRAVELSLDRVPVRVQGNLVRVGDADPVALTERERSVLEVLSERQGAVISKQALLQRVWQDDSDEHAVEVTVGRLRRRLGPAGGSIETVMRRGYRLATG
ncbi:MAG: bifunctional uroporphyrinogen-III synthetase/response regulator domain protein [Ilumatobacteraceae bacterium]|nr:bifunctional uroporphyrinogen-III synthetase/response regulator domain protein [Ilumatobacteraceae bacterium]